MSDGKVSFPLIESDIVTIYISEKGQRPFGQVCCWVACFGFWCSFFKKRNRLGKLLLFVCFFMRCWDYSFLATLVLLMISDPSTTVFWSPPLGKVPSLLWSPGSWVNDIQNRGGEWEVSLTQSECGVLIHSSVGVPGDFWLLRNI